MAHKQLGVLPYYASFGYYSLVRVTQCKKHVSDETLKMQASDGSDRGSARSGIKQ
jgi:hypothetical protein